MSESDDKQSRVRAIAVPQVPEQSNVPVQAMQTMPSDVPVDRGPEVVATTLAPQLGSSSKHLAQGMCDMRLFSVIEAQDVPFLIYARIRSKKNKTWGVIYEEYLHLPVSVAGRGRKDVIRMEGVSKGGLPEYPAEIERPSWVQRNITQRDWRQRAQEDRM